MPVNSKITADELIQWAKSMKSLSAEQLSRVESLAPNLLPEELVSLKTTLEESEMQFEGKTELIQQITARNQEFLSDEQREQRQSKEAVQQVKDAQTADALLSKNL